MMPIVGPGCASVLVFGRSMRRGLALWRGMAGLRRPRAVLLRCLRGVGQPLPAPRRRRPAMFGCRRRTAFAAARRRDPMSGQLAGLGGCGNWRVAVIDRGLQRSVVAGGRLVSHLLLRRSDVLVVLGGELLTGRSRLDPARAAIVADVGGPVDRDVPFVDVGNVRITEIVYGVIVKERAMRPITANKADAGIAETVVDPAVEADARPPETGVKGEPAATPTPIAGRP